MLSLLGEESNLVQNSARQLSHSKGVNGVSRVAASVMEREGAEEIKSGGDSLLVRVKLLNISVSVGC